MISRPFSRFTKKAAPPSSDILTVGETTTIAFGLTRLTMAIIVLGGAVFGSGVENSSAALISLATIVVAVVGLVHGLRIVLRRFRGRSAEVGRNWLVILLDCGLAIGVMSTIDSGNTPLAWLSMLVPVVETAILFSIVPATLTWLGLSVAFLALNLTSSTSSDLAETTLSLALQQVAAVFLISGPAALVTDGARQRIQRLTDARTRADNLSDRLRRVADASNEMSRSDEVTGVLSIAARNSLLIGFDQCDVVMRASGGSWRVVETHAVGPSTPVPAHFLTPAPLDGSETDSLSSVTSSVFTSADDLDSRQMLHNHGFKKGYAVQVALADSDDEAAEDILLRAWTRQAAASDDDVSSFGMLAEQAREIFRATQLLDHAERHASQLLYEVRHDSLTGLANRDYVMKTLESEIARGATMAILFIDLDGFKQINDTLGHRSGDAALIAVAERLQRTVHPRALAGRMGGDEFIVVVPVNALDAPSALVESAEDVVAAISEPLILEGRPANLGASIGVAVQSQGLGADQLISLADSAMYVAKRSGGGVRVAQRLEGAA